MFGRKTAAINVFKEALKQHKNDSKILKCYYHFLNSISTSRFIPNALRSYGDEDLDNFMKEKIENKFKNVKKPVDNQMLIDLESEMKKYQLLEKEIKIESEENEFEEELMNEDTTVDFDKIKKFLYLLPPKERFKKQLNVDQLVDLLKNITLN